MTEVKRYRQPADTPRTMLEFPDGDFVAYSDYAAMEDRFFVAQGIQENAEKNQGYAEFMQKRAEARIDGAEMERDQWRIKATQAKAKAEKAEADLFAWGRHDSMCNHYVETGYKCSCGFTEALAAYSETKP